MKGEIMQSDWVKIEMWSGTINKHICDMIASGVWEPFGWFLVEICWYKKLRVKIKIPLKASYVLPFRTCQELMRFPLA